MAIALVLADLSTCIRRKVGCVLIDEDWHLLATGYNGVAAGQVHCIDEPCPGAELPPGEGLELCEALHAEQNALIRCTRPRSIFAAVITASPCMHCTKMLLNTSCQTIYYLEPYAHINIPRDLWESAGRDWRQVV